MDFFRLTYGLGLTDTAAFSHSESRYEVIGSRDAIWDLWFHLSQLEALATQGQHHSAHPRWLTIYNKDGERQDPTKGLHTLSNSSTFS